VKEPCASFVLIISTPTRPAASKAETNSTNGARGRAFGGRTTRSAGGWLAGAAAGGVLAGGVLAGEVLAGEVLAGEVLTDDAVAGAMRTPSIATSGAVA
jgi:hypothetical protein